MVMASRIECQRAVRVTRSTLLVVAAALVIASPADASSKPTAIGPPTVDVGTHVTLKLKDFKRQDRISVFIQPKSLVGTGDGGADAQQLQVNKTRTSATFIFPMQYYAVGCEVNGEAALCKR